MPACSVIVCTHRRAPLLEQCLHALAELDHPSFEVIVVDNTSGDPATRAVAANASARYEREPRPGLSRARNTGAAAARGSLIAYLDDDAIPERSWLTQHARVLEDTTLIATTGRIIGASATQAGFSHLDRGTVGFRVDAQKPSWFETAVFGGLGFGGNMVFRRKLFEGGFRFHESLGRGATIPAAEELYAFFTLIKRGHTVAYVPSAVIRHPVPETRVDRLAAELDGTRSYSAFLCFLLAEEPAFRGRILRDVIEAVRRTPQPWRPAPSAPRAATRTQTIRAAVVGAWLYLNTCPTRGAGHRRIRSLT